MVVAKLPPWEGKLATFYIGLESKSALRLLQEALQEFIEEDAILRAELRELDAHALAGQNAADNAIGAHGAARDFKDHSQDGVYGRRVERNDKNASHAQRLDAGVWWSPPPYRPQTCPAVARCAGSGAQARIGHRL